MSVGFVFVMACAIGVAQQQTTVAPPLRPVPHDRAADSYAIYSQLLSREPGPLLIEGTTRGAPRPDGNCSENHEVQPPQERKAEFRGVLDDFAKRCYERVSLTAEGFDPGLRVRVADEAMVKQYAAWLGTAVDRRLGVYNDKALADSLAAEFKDIKRMYEFTEVYFNQKHTLAMVYAGYYCGGECGRWQWVVLERKDGKWSVLPWVHIVTMS